MLHFDKVEEFQVHEPLFFSVLADFVQIEQKLVNVTLLEVEVWRLVILQVLGQLAEGVGIRVRHVALASPSKMILNFLLIIRINLVILGLECLRNLGHL